MTTAARGPGRNAPKRTYATFGAFENLVVSGEQRAQRRQFKTVAIDPKQSCSEPTSLSTT